jgi:hypothetical protein
MTEPAPSHQVDIQSATTRLLEAGGHEIVHQSPAQLVIFEKRPT